MGDIQLETIDTQKDLGIVISSDLKTTKYWIEVEFFPVYLYLL